MKPLSSITKLSIERSIAEFVGLGREVFLQKYHFGRAKEFFVIDPLTGTLCDSKAIIGVAYGIQYPNEGFLRPRDFSGGEATVAALLRQHGFVLSDGTQEAPVRREAWARYENELIVEDYIQMLMAELANQKYNKAERARALMPLLNDRSKGSIEFKRANISAVLIDLGFPSLAGYKPRDNYQKDGLVEVVINRINTLPALEKAVSLAVEMPATVPDLVKYESVLVTAPPKRDRTASPDTTRERRGVKRDYLERESRNRSLGHAGEVFILNYERWRLLNLGAGQLAERVVHASEEEGDGLGYDIRSFDVSGKERYIEVKTTSHDPLTPFYISANEADFARETGDQYSLYRVFHFRRDPNFFALNGPIEDHCHLDPTTFRASF